MQGGRGGPLGPGSHTLRAIFTRSLASDGASTWRWSSWVPHALVVNVGTNDGQAAATQDFQDTYVELVMDASAHYGPGLQVFLVRHLSALWDVLVLPSSHASLPHDV